ncbi:MAG: four helix bundle protein, partial [Muribaculaceae bacterium]|nr:four helix bundle protein [Muribaculaceae bacterium]
AISVPSNIAEGQTRNSSKEFIHFLSISKGSLAEIETQLILCNRLGYIQDSTINELTNRLSSISRMIKGLMTYLNMPCPSTPYHQGSNKTTS